MEIIRETDGKEKHSEVAERKKSAEEKAITIVEVVFFLYLLLLLKVIVFKFPLEELRAIAASWKKDVILEGWSTANFMPFKTVRMYLRFYHSSYLHSFVNLFGNILAFVPFGLMLPCISRPSRRWYVLFLNAFLLVAGIECFQLFTAFGKFDVDDILLNCLGAMTGYVLFLALRFFRGRRRADGKTAADGRGNERT